VPPGKEGKIELSVEHTDGYVGEVSKLATVTTNDPKFASFALTLRARFKTEAPPMPVAPIPPPRKRGPVVVEPTNRWDTSVLVGNTSATNYYVVNIEEPLIHVKSIDAGGTNIQATLTPIQDGRRYEVALKTAAGLKPGQYRQTMKVMTDSATMPVVPVELTVTVYPRVFVSPTAIIMPTLARDNDLGTITWPTITVRKIQAAGLKIKKVTSSLPFLDATLETTKDGEWYQVSLKLNTAKVQTGEFKGTIRIETNDTDAPVLEVPVQVSFQ
jgi:hypothetical protein